MNASSGLAATCWAALALALVPVPSARADHGPGTSGGGVSTQSGETLREGKFSLDLRLDYTEFEDLSDEDLQRRAEKAGSFDFLDRSFLTTVSLAYGLIEDVQVGASTGTYHAEDPGEAEFDAESGETEILSFEPDGATDLWLTGKYRFSRGPSGQFAGIGGIKLPTGRHDVENSAGEAIEPSATAGSGAFDGMLGVAYSRWLTERATVDASAQYTLRGEHDDFRLGDRIDAGVAVAYRLVEDIKSIPGPSVFLEMNVRHLTKSEEEGDDDPNTGGTSLFLSPGVRVAFSPLVAVSLSPQFPVLQDLNGEQLETDYKVVAALTLTF